MRSSAFIRLSASASALALAAAAAYHACWRRGFVMSHSATLCAWWVRQRLLRRRLIEADTIDVAAVTLVGGVDISFVKESETDACAALVVLSLPSLNVVYERYERVALRAPYIPGYLAFREVDFLLTLLDELRHDAPHLLPQAILVDGNGVLHPNRFGLACHLGVLGGVPTVGVGKTLHCVDGLTREGVKALALAQCHGAGDAAFIVGHSGATWGAALRTTAAAPSSKHGVEGPPASFNPVLVSVGHGLSLASALELVRVCTKHRVPEPVRQADLRSREWLRTHAAPA